jgi:hypothetical protein
MTTSLHQRILDSVPEAADLYYSLVLVVGGPRSGKTRALRRLAANKTWTLVNVNLQLSELLLDLTQKQRAIRLPHLLGGLTESTAGNEVILLDNTELLFDTDLSQDPLRLLQGLARNRTVVATWRGGFDGTHLTYAELGHPEARRYTRPQAIIVAAGKQETA